MLFPLRSTYLLFQYKAAIFTVVDFGHKILPLMLGINTQYAPVFYLFFDVDICRLQPDYVGSRVGFDIKCGNREYNPRIVDINSASI